MEVYKGESKSILGYLKNEYYFFIPEYQRAYTWSDDNVADLFSSVKKGLKSFELEKDIQRQRKSSTYLGCIIDWLRDSQISDKVPEHSNKNYIDKVRELIDGQQRTSTFSLLCSRLFVKFEELLNEVELNREGRKVAESVVSEYSQILLDCISRYDGNRNNPRPFLIRQGQDRWSINDSKSYSSPLTKYLSEFINYSSKRPKSILLDVGSFPAPKEQQLIDIIDSCDESIEDVVNNLEGLDYIGKKFSGEELFNSLYNSFDKVDLQELEDDKNFNVFSKIVNLAVFTKYWLEYCFVTIISSPSEEKSLDIFQQINSTGSQLSAFDLVKPHISITYRSESKSFSKSETFKIYNEIDEWLKSNSNIGGKRKYARTRNKEFFEILYHYFGIDEELSSNELIWQRKVIKSAFDKFQNCDSALLKGLTKSERANEFCKRLRSIKNFLDFFKLNHSFSNPDKPTKQNLYLAPKSNNKDSFTDIAGFNFLFLLKTNHTICNALIAHFFYQYEDACLLGKNRENAKENLEKIINICSVYFSIYRLAGNKYPDSFWQSYYRDIRLYGCGADNDLIDTVLEDYNFTTKKLKLYDYNDSSSIKTASLIVKTAKYSGKNNALLRYFLLASNDGTVPKCHNSDMCGLLESSKKGASLLKPKYWLSKDTSTIEHVAPQQLIDSSLDNWSKDLFSRSDLINSIGNLTLLKKEINSSVQTDYYKKVEAFSKCFDDNFSLKNDTDDSYITRHCQTLVDGIDKQHHLKSVSLKLNKWLLTKSDIDQWNAEFIQERSLNISNLFVEKCTEILMDAKS